MKPPDGLTPKQEAAVAALLAVGVDEAARRVGVSPVTIWRWQQDPVFREHYRTVRRQALEQATGRLQRLAGDAVEALERNLTCGVPSAEIRAAQAILEQAAKGVELIELEARIAELEQVAETEQGARGRRWRA